MTSVTNPIELDYVPGQDGLQPGQTARAKAPGRLEFRAGDGPLITIEPDYQLTLERAPQSLVMSWQEDGQPMNAAIPVVEFDEYLKTGKIVLQKSGTHARSARTARAPAVCDCAERHCSAISKNFFRPTPTRSQDCPPRASWLSCGALPRACAAMWR